MAPNQISFGLGLTGSPSEWIETRVKRSDSLAGLPNGKMTAYEGWIKLDIDESHDSKLE